MTNKIINCLVFFIVIAQASWLVYCDSARLWPRASYYQASSLCTNTQAGTVRCREPSDNCHEAGASRHQNYINSNFPPVLIPADSSTE